MTDTRQYDVAGATLTVTTVVYPQNILITMTLNTEALDADEPDHTAHPLIQYVDPYLDTKWEVPENYSWCKRRRSSSCQTGSQAKRMREQWIQRLDDMVHAALLDRNRRKAEMLVAVS